MYKMVFLIHKRPGMDSDEFYRYWRETHAPIAAKLPALRKYVQHHAYGEGNEEGRFDGFAELWWDTKEDFERALASPEGQAALADADLFIDTGRMQGFPVEEVPIVSPASDSAA